VTVLGFTAKGDFVTATKTVGEPLKSALYSLDCALISIKTTLPLPYLRTFWSILMPLLYLMIFGLAYFVLILMKKTRYSSVNIYVALNTLLLFV
jgi:hypothetical protein